MSPITATTQDQIGFIPHSLPAPLAKIAHLLTVFFTEAWANFTHVLPDTLSFLYRERISKTIESISLSETVEKTIRVATLFIHKPPKEKVEQEGSPVLFLHGDHGHPFTTLNLADRVQQINRPVYSLHIPYDDNHPEYHQIVLTKAIDKIKELSSDTFKKITLVGHSKGAIISGYQAYVNKDPRIDKVISLAGRLGEPSDKSCSDNLKPIIAAVEKGIQENVNPPLYVIAGDRDWNAPHKAMFVRQDPSTYHVEKGAMHLNILYKEGTGNKLIEFLQRA